MRLPAASYFVKPSERSLKDCLENKGAAQILLSPQMEGIAKRLVPTNLNLIGKMLRERIQVK